MSADSKPLWWLAALVVVGAPMLGCAKPLTAETEVAAGTDFSQYQTYRWITDDLILIRPGTGDPMIRNIENERRIRAAVERELAAKGLSKVSEAEGAELVVAFTLGTKVRSQIQGGATALDLVTDEASITKGVLTLYLFDRANQTQVWSASTKKDLEPGTDPDAIIDAAVAVLMAEFPPE